MWRKNRSKKSNTQCRGVDINRNFDYGFGGEGTSSNPCSEIFCGTSAFTELESQAVRAFAEKRFKNKNILKLYLTFHSYGNLMLHPFGYSAHHIPSNVDELKKVGLLFSKSIENAGGASYSVGTSAILYPAPGSDDWFYGYIGVPLAFTVELPEGGTQGFNPNPSEISGIVKVTFEGVRALHLYVHREFPYRRRSQHA